MRCQCLYLKYIHKCPATGLVEAVYEWSGPRANPGLQIEQAPKYAAKHKYSTLIKPIRKRILLCEIGHESRAH